MNELQNNYDALKRLHDSVNLRVIQLESENKALMQANEILVAEKKQWEQQKALQEQVIAQQLGNSDGVVRLLQDEILGLRAKIKGLIHGD